MSLAFVSGVPIPAGEVALQTHSLRGSEGTQFQSSLPDGTHLVVSTLAVTVMGVGARAAKKSVTCRATAVKKKGVRVVEGKEIPWNLFSPKAPYQGKVVKNQSHEHTITKPNSDAPSDANWETAHVTFDHGGNVPYLEGQSIEIIAPGPDKKGETPAKIRLYSIGSSAVGDFEDSKTVSLCVKRVVEVEEEKWPLKHSNRDVGEDKPDKAGTHFPNAKVYRGVCSNHICDMNVGDDVLITGPTGAEMLLPEDPNANIIMLATGTGIAPYRSMWKRLFVEDTPGRENFKGQFWVFLGVANSDALLYDDELMKIKTENPDQFRVDYALSREQTNAKGGKMYIQDKVEEYSEEIFDRMDKGAHMYFCGLKGMMPGITEMLEGVSKSKGLDFEEKLKEWKKKGQWHVEVY